MRGGQWENRPVARKDNYEVCFSLSVQNKKVGHIILQKQLKSYFFSDITTISHLKNKNKNTSEQTSKRQFQFATVLLRIISGSIWQWQHGSRTTLNHTVFLCSVVDADPTDHPDADPDPTFHPGCGSGSRSELSNHGSNPWKLLK